MSLKNRYISILFVLLTAVIILKSHADQEGQPQGGPAKGFMHTFLIELNKTQEIWISPEKLQLASNKEIIGGSLAALEKKLKTTPQESQQSEGFKVNFDILRDHILQTKQAYDRGQFDLARARFLSTTQLCVACHTQNPAISNSTPFEFMLSTPEKPSYESAQFLFVTRRYVAALKMIDELIRGYPQTGLSEEQVTELAHKKLATYARVWRTPNEALPSLTEDLKNSKLPAPLKKAMKVWVKDFTAWSKETKNTVPTDSPAATLAFIEKNLPEAPTKAKKTHPDQLRILRYSGYVYELMYNKNLPRDLTQKALFLTAKAERTLSPLTWYSLADVYLKECIVQFPQQPYSKKCFEDLKTSLDERSHQREDKEAFLKSLEHYL